MSQPGALCEGQTWPSQVDRGSGGVREIVMAP